MTQAQLPTKSPGGSQRAFGPRVSVTRIAYGVAEHARREDDCRVSEVTISSRYCSNPHPKRGRSDCRLDCIKECRVIEIKPDNTAEREKGRRQSAAYTKGLILWYGDKGDQMFSDGDDGRKLAPIKDCVKGDGDNKRLDVSDGQVETYDFCEGFKESELLEGVETSDPSVEIPDSER